MKLNTSKLAAGTKVKMSAKGIEHWGNTYGNPVGEVGTIFDVGAKHFYGFQDRVQWSDGVTNSYMANELEVVEEQSDKTTEGLKYEDVKVGKAYRVIKDLDQYDNAYAFTPGSVVFVVYKDEYGLQLTNDFTSEEHTCNLETGDFNLCFDNKPWEKLANL